MINIQSIDYQCDRKFYYKKKADTDRYRLFALMTEEAINNHDSSDHRGVVVYRKSVCCCYCCQIS